jgi:hypothetical protein
MIVRPGASRSSRAASEHQKHDDEREQPHTAVPRSARRPARGRRICSATAHHSGTERGPAARPCEGRGGYSTHRAVAAVGWALIGPPPRSRQGTRGQIALAGAVAQQLLVVWSSRARRASSAADRIRRPRLSHALGESYQRFAASGPLTPKRPGAPAPSPSSTANLPAPRDEAHPTGRRSWPERPRSAPTAPSLHVRLDNRTRRSSHHAVVPFGRGRLGPQSAAPIAAGCRPLVEAVNGVWAAVRLISRPRMSQRRSCPRLRRDSWAGQSHDHRPPGHRQVRAGRVASPSIRGTAVVKNVFLPGLVALALGTPPVAEASPAVGGFLSFRSAIRFQEKYFPPVAPTLLRDNRARFFWTKRPIEVNSCKRVNRPTVICIFSLILNPDAAHRKAHWFPIRCRGKVRSRQRVDGSIIGDVRNYTCRTIFPKK